MKSNFEQIVELSSSRAPLTNIQRISNERFKTEFNAIAATGNPIVYNTTSVLIDSIELLKTRIGDQPLKLRSQKFGDSENYNPLNREYVDSMVADFVDSIVSGQAECYAGNIPFDGDTKAVFGVSPPDMVPPRSLRKPSVLLGSPGCVTPLHRDSADNFAIHVFGTKRWTLFPPEQSQYLGILRMERLAKTGGEFAISEINIGNPDLDRFPEFKNARAIQVDIHKGEVFFCLPDGTTT